MGREPLLLFDEPKANAQLGCVTVSGPCNTLGTGNGVSTYNGTARHPSIFQGAQNGPNSVTFYGVPLDPPGTNSTRIIRATNIRANANQLSAAGALTVPITGSISFSNLNIPPVTLATTQPGVLLGTPVTGSLNWCPSENGGQIVTASGGPAHSVCILERVLHNLSRWRRRKAGSFQTSLQGSRPTSEGLTPGRGCRRPLPTICFYDYSWRWKC